MLTLKNIILTLMEMLWRMTFIWTFSCGVPGGNLNDMEICFLEFQKSTYKMWGRGRQKINCQKLEALSWWEGRRRKDGWAGRWHMAGGKMSHVASWLLHTYHCSSQSCQIHTPGREQTYCWLGTLQSACASTHVLPFKQGSQMPKAGQLDANFNLPVRLG